MFGGVEATVFDPVRGKTFEFYRARMFAWGLVQTMLIAHSCTNYQERQGLSAGVLSLRVSECWRSLGQIIEVHSQAAAEVSSGDGAGKAAVGEILRVLGVKKSEF